LTPQTVTLATEAGPIEAEIVEMQPRHVNDFETIWRDFLRELNQDDAFWNWAMKKRLSVTNDRYEAYALQYEGLTQGLLWLETQWHRCWRRRDRRLVYIEAIASAPWNRRELQETPYIKGVGTALLLYARQRSLELGYEGRVGLHSLASVETFYQGQNMANYGKDPEKENLRYFEYGPLEGTGSGELDE
jgi:hypothetical protein